MSNVDESGNENDSSDEDPIMLDESSEDEVKHDPFEFLHDDEIPFPRLLFDLTIWQVQAFDNGNANSNMPLLKNDFEMLNAPPQLVHVPMAPSQDRSMQLMNSMEMNPLISVNTPLIQIIILEPNAQHTLNNTSNIQMNPLVNPPNIVIDDIGNITLEPGVGPHMISSTNAPQVVDPSPLSLKATRLEELIEGDSNFYHAPISQYL